MLSIVFTKECIPGAAQTLDLHGVGTFVHFSLDCHVTSILYVL